MKGFWNGVAALLGAGIALFGILMLGYQIVFWLLHGHWSPLKLALAWQSLGGKEPQVAWWGLQRTISLILDLPLAGILVFFGILIYMVAIPNVERTVRL